MTDEVAVAVSWKETHALVHKPGDEEEVYAQYDRNDRWLSNEWDTIRLRMPYNVTEDQLVAATRALLGCLPALANHTE